MRTSPQRQYSFTAGQLDKSMIARADIDHYLKGALELTNVVCMPTGGVTLRGGLVKDFEITDGANGIRLNAFEVDPTTGLLCVFTDKKIRIYDHKTLCETIDTEYSGNNLYNLDMNQKLDTMIITSKDYQIKELVRQGSNTSWGFNNVDLTNAPQYTFSNTEGGVNEIQQIKFKSFQAGDSIRISLDGFKGKSVIYSSSATETANNIKNSINGMENIDSKAGGVTVTVVTTTQFNVEFVGTDGKQSKPDMILAIEDQASTAAQVVLKVIQEGKTPQEDLFSATRGWPYSSCFCQGRLIFGGSYAIPYMVNGSATNSPYNFRTTSDNLDDEAVNISADADGNCEVRRVLAMERLFILTNKGVFAVKEMPITPGVGCTKQTDMPCAMVRPKEIDSSMVYVTQNSEGVNQTVASLTYTYENEKYKTDDLAYLVPGILREPKFIDVRRSIKRNHATYLFVVNADGTLAVLNSKQSEGLNGWSLCKTEGKFLDVAVINDITYFAVSRVIDGVTHYYIEHWDDDAKLDLGTTLESATPKSVWSGNDFKVFNNKTIGVYTDGLPYGTVKVENNSIELNYAAKKIEFGFPFDWTVETMPAVVETEDYTLVGNNYRVPSVSVHLQNTAGINLNGEQICNRLFGRDRWDSENILFDGIKTVSQIGWFGDDEQATVRLTGTSLQPATILSATMEVIY